MSVIPACPESKRWQIEEWQAGDLSPRVKYSPAIIVIEKCRRVRRLCDTRGKFTGNYGYYGYLLASGYRLPDTGYRLPDTNPLN